MSKVAQNAAQEKKAMNYSMAYHHEYKSISYRKDILGNYTFLPENVLKRIFSHQAETLTPRQACVRSDLISANSTPERHAGDETRSTMHVTSLPPKIQIKQRLN